METWIWVYSPCFSTDFSLFYNHLDYCIVVQHKRPKKNREDPRKKNWRSKKKKREENLPTRLEQCVRIYVNNKRDQLSQHNDHMIEKYRGFLKRVSDFVFVIPYFYIAILEMKMLVKREKDRERDRGKKMQNGLIAKMRVRLVS